MATVPETPPPEVQARAPARSRLVYVAALLVVCAVGLPTRLHPEAVHPFLVAYGGDAIWALAVFLVFGALFPRARTRTAFLAALAFAWGIEFSQFYQADWINAIRATRVGGLILGYTFLWSDLLSYTVGVSAGALLERAALLRPPLAR